GWREQIVTVVRGAGKRRALRRREQAKVRDAVDRRDVRRQILQRVQAAAGVVARVFSVLQAHETAGGVTICSDGERGVGFGDDLAVGDAQAFAIVRAVTGNGGVGL